MGPKTRTTAEWSLADDDFDTAMGPATHELENGAGDVQLDDAGQAAEMATGMGYEETHGAKTDSSRDRQVKVLRSYPLVFAFRDRQTRRLVPCLLACLESGPYYASCSFRCIGPRFVLVVASLFVWPRY